MTTVAYRDGVMAADTRGVRYDMPRICHKIHRVADAIIGFAGNYSDCLVFIDWWRDGHDLKKLPEFKMYRGESDAPDIEALVLTADGIERWTEHFQRDPILDPFFAIGSGAGAAMAAMHMGADAAEAVRIASLVFTSTGGNVQVERLDGEPWTLMTQSTFEARAAKDGVIEVEVKASG